MDTTTSSQQSSPSSPAPQEQIVQDAASQTLSLENEILRETTSVKSDTKAGKLFVCNECKREYASAIGLKRHRKKQAHQQADEKECKSGVEMISCIGSVRFFSDSNSNIYLCVD